tara:strand:- start:1677 stop:2558 length:882 start_codon:yes stop_codon:yes gene_type:complete
MKKTLYFTLIVFLFGCDNTNENFSDEKIAIDSLKLEIQSKNNTITELETNVEMTDSLVNQYALYVGRIKENLAEINSKEVFLKKLKTKNGENLSVDSLNILSAIELMAQKIEENEKLIKVLNKNLGGTKAQSLKLKGEITQLQEIVAKSNREVYFLKEELSSLNASYSAMFDKFNQQKITINNLNSHINEIAFVIGTKSELLENGVLTKEGGVIGIGKSRRLSNELNTDYLTTSSKLDFESLILGYKSVKIITPHPLSSYKLFQSSKESIDSLVVLNKSTFWKNSKYLVIEVK